MTNKLLVIGDIHGRELWKNIVTSHRDADMVIFMGDYFDSFHVDPSVQIQNFKAIIEYKKLNEDKVVLLLGNHVT